MDNLTFEQKVAMLAMAKSPQEKQALIAKFSTNAAFFLGINKRTMPLKQYMDMNRDKFAVVAERAKDLRKNMKNKGWTDKKYQKYKAELPEDLFNDRPEFSAYLPQPELQANIKAFLVQYPMFRVDE